MATGKGKGPGSPGRGKGGQENKGGSGGGYDGGGRDDREPPGEEPENLDIHEAYLQHRLGGGERPTTQAFGRAVAQFKKLPGAVRGKPAVKSPERSKGDQEPQPDRTGKKS